MLPITVATEAKDKETKEGTTLGKRPAAATEEGKPEKRKKQDQSYGKFLAEQKATQAAEELLDKLLVEPKVTFSEIGGLDKTIKELREMIEWPLKYDNIFNFLGVKPPRGILISGPAGVGKTQLALAIAGENPEVPFYKINAPELVSGISGQSEEKIRQIFKGVRAKAPAVVFIDELDCIAGKRENAGKDMEVRIVAQLASCLDELDKAEERIVVVGVTSRPETID